MVLFLKLFDHIRQAMYYRFDYQAFLTANEVKCTLKAMHKNPIGFWIEWTHDLYFKILTDANVVFHSVAGKIVDDILLKPLYNFRYFEWNGDKDLTIDLRKLYDEHYTHLAIHQGQFLLTNTRTKDWILGIDPRNFIGYINVARTSKTNFPSKVVHFHNGKSRNYIISMPESWHDYNCEIHLPGIFGGRFTIKNALDILEAYGVVEFLGD